MNLDLTITARRAKPTAQPYYANTKVEYEDYTAARVVMEGSQRAIVGALRSLAETLDQDGAA